MVDLPMRTQYFVKRSNIFDCYRTKSIIKYAGQKIFQSVSEVTCHVSEAFSDTERGLAGGFQLYIYHPTDARTINEGPSC